MSALDDIRRALTEAYGTGVVLDDLTADDLIKAAVREFELDAQAYPGELAMLRGLVRTLRVVVRPDDVDVREVRRLLHQHSADEGAALASFRTIADRPADTARQAALLNVVLAEGGGWKSGRALRALHQLGFTSIGQSTASHDLAALAAGGHLIRFEEKGVRWYEPAQRESNRA
ncbi:hypothetical protein [Streptomyces sp.]|uniref:hypothetical protein n=1 Tax=Streptomyces sp. TaxID=1931 RepID=UPI002D27B525|nr:hypothetical protein [Streptomyces sp.]HZF92023.1 hypothetical protein [Streptomyces sp.]